MAKAKTAKHPAVEAKAPDAEPAISKAAMVRTAVTDGVTSPTEIVEYVKVKYNTDITKEAVSAYKSQQKMREQGKAQPKASAKTPATHTVIDDVAAVKSLVDKLGAASVKKLVSLFE